MSRIDRLAIAGVRSFGEEKPETIKFNTPLTLIVGYNGSGKTTIIECLKYATTGQLPPNSKNGAAFVHDPKLTGYKEVKAQVRLGFRAVAGHKMTVTRNMQVTVQKNKNPTMKTVDCLLLIIKDGERTTVSSKVAVMDAVMPQYIGVSRAVLDNVIFCHQDESLWPMSEPSVLKKKFDEIFEALKYTAAVKNINELQKTQKNLLTNYKIQHDNEKQNKERGDRAQERSVKLSDSIEKDRQQLENLQQAIKTAVKTKAEKWRRANNAAGIVNQLNTKQQQAQNIQQSIDRLIPNLEIREESDEWLRSTLDRYEEQMKQYDDEDRGHQSQYNELKQSISASQKQSAAKQAEMGQRQAEKANHERQLTSRAQLVQVAAHQHSLRGYDGDLDEEQVREFVGRIRKLLREKDRELERVKKTSEEDLLGIQTELNDLENRKSVRTQARLNARQMINANDKSQDAKQREAAAINMDEGSKAALEKAQADAQSKLDDLNAEYDAAEWDKQLNTENNRQLELENEKARLLGELKKINKLANDRAELEYNKKEAKETQRKLDTMQSTYGTDLSSVIGAEFTWENLAHDFQTVVDQRAESVADAKREQEATDVQLREIELKLKQSRARLTQKKDDMQKRQKSILNSMVRLEDKKPLESVDEYPLQLEALEEEYKAVERDLHGLEYRVENFTICRNTVETKNACHLCERPFKGEEKSAALKKIDEKLKQLVREDLEEELSVLKRALSPAVAARSDYEIFKTLSVEISDLEKEIRGMDRTKTPLLRQFESHDRAVAEEVSAQRDLGALANTVKTITSYIENNSKLEAKVASLSSQHKLTGSSLSSDEIDQQQSMCDDRIRGVKVKISQITGERDQTRAKITSLDKELAEIKHQLISATYDLEKKQSLLSEVEELRRLNAGLRNTIQGADDHLEALAPEVAKAKVRYEDAQKRGRAKEKEIQSGKDKLSDTANKFKLFEDDINRYIEDGGPQQLAACERAIKALEQEQKRLGAELDEVAATNNQVKKLIHDADRTKRSIIDNIQYRKDVHDLEVVTNEISDLNAHNAADDHAHLEREAVKADQAYALLNVEVASLASSIREKDTTLKEALDLWETDYKDAAQNYREARVRVGTAQAAIEDLGKYSGALEAAIMKFHTLKMEEINRFAGELWQQTYQGSDIDTIMVRSENENAQSKRSYNYRVVMVKSNTEMDMRGRCSAGQKVLASIIIRLALAECFGVNCGIIALDEPTTNLDGDNIQALARSLHALIRNRRQQSNFQLLVITHDEAFLREMKCQEFCETYFSVSRNDKQNSVINEEPITKLMGN